MNIMMTNTKDNNYVLTISQFNPCKPFVYFKYRSNETFLINLNLVPKSNTGYCVAYLCEV